MRDKRIFYSYQTKDKHECAENADSVRENYADPFTEMTIRLLKASGFAEFLDEKMKKLGKTPDTMRIAIKPNLVSPVPADFGATTHPQIVEGIIRYLHFLGYKDITVMEGSWVGDDTADSFLYCGYQELAQKCGVRLVDAKKEPAVAVEIPEDVRRRMDMVPSALKVCRCALEPDFLINVPVLKGHCQTRMTCALKNMKGLIPDAEKRHFHAMGLHVPIALLNTIIHQDFIVIDHICGDPEFEDGGNPLVRNCVMAAYDPVAADIAACEALGVDPQSVGYLRLSAMLAEGCGGQETRAGTDEKPYDIRTGEYAHIDKIIIEGEPCEAVADTHRLLDVNYMVDEVESCSACYSVLIGALDRLKTDVMLDRLAERLACKSIRIGIGQGCRGKHGKIGVGQCTAGFEWTVKGCPPEEDDIYDMLRRFCEA